MATFIIQIERNNSSRTHYGGTMGIVDGLPE